MPEPSGLGWPVIECLCNVGVQKCPVHPDHLWDAYRRMDFEKDWDARVKEGQRREQGNA